MLPSNNYQIPVMQGVHDDLREMLYDISDLTSVRNKQRDKFKSDLRKLIERAKAGR